VNEFLKSNTDVDALCAASVQGTQMHTDRFSVYLCILLTCLWRRLR